MLVYNQINGWIDGVKHCPSPNYDARPEGVPISLLVVHNISLPPGEFGSDHIGQLFCNCLDPAEHPFFKEIADLKVSSHLLIRRDGEIVQFVPLTARAWHAGVSHFDGCDRCNDFSIGIELEGTDDLPYEPIQYTQLVRLTSLVRSEWPAISSERIVGHDHIAPGRKTDPGQAFDWDAYLTAVASN